MKYSILWRVSSAVGEYRRLALGKPLITSSPQRLSCSSLVLCYVFHLGGNTGNVGSTSSRATLQPLCWLPHPAESLFDSIRAHTGRLHCWSDSRPVLPATLNSSATSTWSSQLLVPLPWSCSTGFVTGSTCVLWPWVSWVQDRFSLPFAERMHIWICPSKDYRTSGTELFGALWDLWFGCQWF